MSHQENEQYAIAITFHTKEVSSNEKMADSCAARRRPAWADACKHRYAGQDRFMFGWNLSVTLLVKVALYAMFMAASGAVIAAPATFHTALPVGKGEFIFRQQFVLNQSGDDPGGAGRDRTELTFVSVLGYGVTPDLCVFGVAPYTDRIQESSTGTQRASGPSNAGLFGRYTVYQKDSVSATFRIAPFAGIKAPTGDDSKTDSLGKPPAGLQPGSGSWDIFGGDDAFSQPGLAGAASQIGYQKNLEANGRRAGDMASADASLQYRLRRREP